MPLPILFLAAPAALTLLESAAVAVGACALGYSASKLLDNSEKRKRKAERKGFTRAKAEYDLRLERFQAHLDSVRGTDKLYFSTVIAVAGAAYAYAHDRGLLTTQMRARINTIFFGALHWSLPQAVLEKMQTLALRPLSYRDALHEARAAGAAATQACTELPALLGGLVFEESL